MLKTFYTVFPGRGTVIFLEMLSKKRDGRNERSSKKLKIET